MIRQGVLDLTAEDVVAEAIRYAREHPGQWREIPDERLPYYLRTIARYVILYRARKARVRREVPFERPSEVASHAEGEGKELPSPTFLLHKGDKVRALGRLLGRLRNESHREVLRLVWIEGLRVSEAARRLGRTTKATQKLLERAMQAARSVGQAEAFRGFRVSGETR